MCFWVMQPFRLDLRIVAFYANHGEGIAHYINWLNDFKKKFGVNFEKHYAPHDIEVKELTTGVSRSDTAKTMGIEFITVPRVKNKRDSIEATRIIFPRLWIDPERCDVEPINGAKVRGYEAIRKYRREWDEDRQIFSDKPYHDWSSNPADALQQLGMSWEDKQKPRPRPKRSTGSWQGV
jgi:phage terminase large subunit